MLKLRKLFRNLKKDITYLDTAKTVIDKMAELRNNYNMHPKYVVLGYKNYLQLLLYVSEEIKGRPSTLREFLGCDIVVIPGKEMVEVVPDILEYVGIRTS